MELSAVICTYNREDYLELAVHSLLEQQTDALFEILVVDNSATGSALPVIERFQDQRIRYFHEAITGLSHARNRGIREAHGEIIAFLDDDAIASTSWVDGLLSVYRRDPAAVCVGGQVDMLCAEQVETDWLPDDFLAYLSILHFGDSEFVVLDHTEYPIGVNVSFRREVFQRLGLFHTAFGRIGTSLLSCEDTEYCHKIQEVMPESRIYYTPAAVVQHNVLPERLTKDWFRRRLYWQGISECLFEKQVFGRVQVVRRALRAALFSLPMYLMRFFVSHAARNRRRAFYFTGMFLMEFGYIQQAWNVWLFGEDGIC